MNSLCLDFFFFSLPPTALPCVSVSLHTLCSLSSNGSKDGENVISPQLSSLIVSAVQDLNAFVQRIEQLFDVALTLLPCHFVMLSLVSDVLSVEPCLLANWFSLSTLTLASLGTVLTMFPDSSVGQLKHS